ncbi:MAG: hypothetical protein EXS55_03600 [Candidatus Magasanikbacteria bacterium]|nr:hypothetical protein [Candidatus Magasanikbacteria bacterium]
MTVSIRSFFAACDDKILAINTFFQQYNLLDKVIADHIGYKCSTSTEFEELRQLLEPHSLYLYQSYISGRRIVYFKLKRPVLTLLGPIYFFELSDQKMDGKQTSGFDHIEIFSKKSTATQLVSDLKKQGVVIVKTDRPHHTTYDIKLIKEFKLKIEEERLLDKIMREEMGSKIIT